MCTRVFTHLSVFHSFPAIPCDLLHSQACFWTNVAVSAGFLNMCLFLFNLFIPAYPLDASRILVDFFALCNVEVNRAALITACISFPIGLALLGYGFWAFARGAANYTMTIFLAIFILYSTWGVIKAARSGTAARHPMFIHYYRTSEPPVSATAASSSNAGTASSTAGGQITSLWGSGLVGTSAAGTGVGGESTGGNVLSKMEAGKGHRLGGKPAPSSTPAGNLAVGARTTSQSALLTGSSSSSAAAGPSTLGGASKGGYRLGSK